MRITRTSLAAGLLMLAIASAPIESQAQAQYCGVVNILQFLAGPRHGSLMQVSNPSCGPGGGWVCLDPDGQYLSSEKGKRMHAFLLAQYLTRSPVKLWIDRHGGAHG